MVPNKYQIMGTSVYQKQWLHVNLGGVDFKYKNILQGN